MLTCCVCAGAWAQGTLNVPVVNRSAANGGTVRQAIIVKKSTSCEGVVKIQLDGSANYRDMQFDLTLPEGISLVTEPTTDNPVVKVDAKEEQNHVLFYALEGQTVKIAVVDNVVNLPDSTTSASADEYGKYLTDGIVFELPIKAAATFEGVKNATISNLAFTDDAATADIAVTGTTTFGIDDILLGDVNDNGEVEIGDATCVVNNVTNLPNEVYIEDVADMNGDEFTGDIGDATSIVNYVVGTVGTAKKYIFVEEDALPDPE